MIYHKPELIQRVADHLTGRPSIVRWESPPSATAVGQAFKTLDGKIVIYVGELTGIDSRFKVWLHELAHGRWDYDILPIIGAQAPPAGSVKQTQKERAEWRKNPRELRAQRQADDWYQYAERNAYKYFTGYQSPMECKLLALLDWSE
jgi:hypothetical protein